MNKDILEGNKLIAEFMGKPLRHPAYHDEDKLKYHTSWDWLMPVVEKIHTMDDFYTVDMGSIMLSNLGMNSHILYCVIKNSNRKIVAEKSGVNTLTEAVYGAVVQFIQWYNNQNTRAKVDDKKGDY